MTPNKTAIISIGTATEMWPRPLYLKTFDPDYVPDNAAWKLTGITGRATFTADVSEAMRFDTLEDAMRCWQQQSTRQPLRGDGRPNKPLTAYTISFREVPPL